MAIIIECTAGELGNIGNSFSFNSPEAVGAFKELVQRGSNLWPDAPPVIKEFADVITTGSVQQDYWAQANISKAPLQFKQDPVNPRVYHNPAQVSFDYVLDKELPVPYTKFELDVAMFNEMYGLTQLHTASREEILERCRNYKTILTNEVNEYDDIIRYLETAPVSSPWRLEVFTMLADLMGDIQVYCASEMKRFNIPNQQVLDIIMQSNFSKLGADGQPIKNELGKVMKGPNYWKPEPKIELLLLTVYEAEIAAAERQQEEDPHLTDKMPPY